MKELIEDIKKEKTFNWNKRTASLNKKFYEGMICAYDKIICNIEINYLANNKESKCKDNQ